MQGNILGQSAGINIHGIIEEYKVAAGENVRAGDFVKFVQDKGKLLEEKSIVKKAQTMFTCLSSVLLDENRVLVVAAVSGGFLYSIVCTVTNENFDYNITILAECKGSSYCVSACKMDNSDIFIGYQGNDSKLYGTIITVNVDNSIGIKVMKCLSETLKPYPLAVTYLGENRIFLTAMQTPDEGITALLHGVVASVSDTNIIVVTDTLLTNKHTHYEKISISKHRDNKILIAYGKSDTESCALFAMLISISSNGVITVNFDECLVNKYNAGLGMTVTKIDKNRFFIGHTYVRSESENVTAAGPTSGVVIKISGDVLEKIGIDTQLNTFDSTASYGLIVSSCLLSKNQIFFTYQSYWNLDKFGYYCSEIVIDETEIWVQSSQLITNGAFHSSNSLANSIIDVVLIAENKVFMVYLNKFSAESSYSCVAGRLFLGQRISGVRTVHAISNNIFGVAKTSGKDGQLIKVITANCKESEEI